MRKDLVLVVGAYVSFGILPLFWAQLGHVEPYIVAISRTVCCLIFLAGILTLQGRFHSALKGLTEGSYVRGVMTSACFLATNWVSYLIALQRGEILSASLAYYLAPIMTMVGATLFLGESMSRAKKVAVLCLVVGVSTPVVVAGQLPWMALVIGGSWVAYTLVRRRCSVLPVEGLFQETLLLTVLMAVSSPFFAPTVASHFAFLSPATWLLLIATGPVTALPLLALVSGMRTVPMQIVGVSQYVAPTVKLVLSLVYFGIYPRNVQLVGLGFIWLGILVFFVGEAVVVRWKGSSAMQLSSPC